MESAFQKIIKIVERVKEEMKKFPSTFPGAGKKFIPYLNYFGSFYRIGLGSNKYDEAEKSAIKFAKENFTFNKTGYAEEGGLSVHVRYKNPHAYNSMDEQRGTPAFVFDEVNL